jgi:hypothetical protein
MSRRNSLIWPHADVDEEACVPAALEATAAQIASAIDAFSAAYHDDYFRVRALRRRHLAAAAGSALAPNLVTELRTVLTNWGAGRRDAPECSSFTQILTALRAPSLHGDLCTLHGASLSSLTVIGPQRCFVGKPPTPAALQAFDAGLFATLNTLGKELFRENTNATYPMKAALLLTGLMPAFDSQVKNGLQRGGFAGMKKTRYLLPDRMEGADWKKISRLPFLLGECWNTHQSTIAAGIAQSTRPALINDPGRFFDVLLFMQGNRGQPVLLRNAGTPKWYELT